MYNVLLILLHRPFVSEGHLATPSVTANAFGVCTRAATDIVRLLVAYDRSFSIKRAPYLFSYATYVAATIHARIAAQKDVNSEAHTYLAACLKVFKQNQETNAAMRRAHAVINNLMKKLKVEVHDDEHDDEQAGLGEIVRGGEAGVPRTGSSAEVQLRRTAQMSWNRGPTALNTSRHHTAGFDEAGSAHAEFRAGYGCYNPEFHARPALGFQYDTVSNRTKPTNAAEPVDTDVNGCCRDVGPPLLLPLKSMWSSQNVRAYSICAPSLATYSYCSSRMALSASASASL